MPSPKWPGRYSPEQEIRDSGMWLKRGLNGKPLTEEEFSRLLELCGQRPQITKAKTSDPTTSKSQTPAAKVPGQSCGKYAPLLQFLQRQTAQRVVMTYAEIEGILGFKLPNSAYNYTMWWNPKGHPHCQAWLQAGFNVADVAESIRTKIVTFERT
jgi:hypothetical protein